MKKTGKITLKSIKNALDIVWRTFLLCVVVFLVFTAGVLAYDRFVKKSSVPTIFGYSLLVIATPSMTDAISVGDAVIVEKCSNYVVGDVITYFPYGENLTVTHRVVRTEGDKIYTKGDANDSEDPNPVYADQIVGKVTEIVPKIGLVIEWMKTPTGIGYILTITILLITIGIVYGNNDTEVLRDAKL